MSCSFERQMGANGNGGKRMGKMGNRTSLQYFPNLYVNWSNASQSLLVMPTSDFHLTTMTTLSADRGNTTGMEDYDQEGPLEKFDSNDRGPCKLRFVFD